MLHVTVVTVGLHAASVPKNLNPKSKDLSRKPKDLSPKP